MDKYDYIIVGGGSAGCVLANRLSADPNTTVLLLEAGPTHQSMVVKIPFFTTLMLPYWFKNWHLFTTPQPGLNGRCGYQPRGKVLGGSSSINAMIYIRGQREDYDEWSTLVDARWSYESVLPIFKSFESNTRIHNDYHGQSGELSVSDIINPNAASNAFVESAKALGYDISHDFNGQSQHGVGLYQVTQKNGLRHTSADAFLSPSIMQRKNLTVMTKARTLKILTQGKRATGVQVLVKGKSIEFKANKRVILSAGAIHSPQLLMLSGIGREAALKSHGIPVVHDLPGVGENLQDHPDYVDCYSAKGRDLFGFSPLGLWDITKSYFQYLRSKPNFMSTNFAEAGGFLSTNANDARPDIQLHFVPGIVDNHARTWHFKRGISCHVCVLRPYSRGNITLKSSNPLDAPLINPNFLSDDRDVDVLLKGYKMTEAIMNHQALLKYAPNPLYPAKTDEEKIRRLRERADTVYHPVGSCKMGNDALSVVDTHLSVHGMEGLSVVDASVMPTLISGNTNAPTMMIAIKAAESILNMD